MNIGVITFNASIVILYTTFNDNIKRMHLHTMYFIQNNMISHKKKKKKKQVVAHEFTRKYFVCISW